MKKWLIFVLLVATAAGIAFAADPDVLQQKSCSYCGMSRGKFAHSRMLIEYDDGSSVGVCSLRCAAVDLVNNLDKSPRRISVGDYADRTLIDAEKAVWVIGGNKAGVMTGRAKWAFAGDQGAETFIKEHGGSKAGFDAAMKAAFEDLYLDTKMVRERRKMKKKM